MPASFIISKKKDERACHLIALHSWQDAGLVLSWGVMVHSCHQYTLDSTLMKRLDYAPDKGEVLLAASRHWHLWTQQSPLRNVCCIPTAHKLPTLKKCFHHQKTIWREAQKIINLLPKGWVLTQPILEYTRNWGLGGFRMVQCFEDIQFSSVAQSCLTLCDPMNRSTPGLPVHHQLPEFTQTRSHRVSDAIQPSHPLSSPSPPAPNPSQHQSLSQWVNSSHEVAKVLEFQL